MYRYKLPFIKLARKIKTFIAFERERIKAYHEE